MSDLNIAKQFDQPFLIGETPGEVARYLNKLIKLEEIDTVLIATESKKRAERKNGETITSNITSTETSLNKLLWVEDASKLYKLAEDKEATIKVLDQENDNLIRAVAGLAVQNSLLTNKEIVADADALVRAIDIATEAVAKKETTQVELAQLLTSLTSMEELLACPIGKMNKCLADIDKTALGISTSIVELRTLESLQEALLKADEALTSASTLKRANALVERLEDAMEEIKVADLLLVTLDNYITTIRQCNNTIKDCSATKAELELGMPEECPLCGSSMEKGHTHE
jgi:hypothetical protein